MQIWLQLIVSEYILAIIVWFDEDFLEVFCPYMKMMFPLDANISQVKLCRCSNTFCLNYELWRCVLKISQLDWI